MILFSLSQHRMKTNL